MGCSNTGHSASASVQTAHWHTHNLLCREVPFLRSHSLGFAERDIDTHPGTCDLPLNISVWMSLSCLTWNDFILTSEADSGLSWWVPGDRSFSQGRGRSLWTSRNQDNSSPQHSCIWKRASIHSLRHIWNSCIFLFKINTRLFVKKKEAT